MFGQTTVLPKFGKALTVVPGLGGPKLLVTSIAKRQVGGDSLPEHYFPGEEFQLTPDVRCEFVAAKTFPPDWRGHIEVLQRKGLTTQWVKFGLDYYGLEKEWILIEMLSVLRHIKTPVRISFAQRASTASAADSVEEIEWEHWGYVPGFMAKVIHEQVVVKKLPPGSMVNAVFPARFRLFHKAPEYDESRIQIVVYGIVGEFSDERFDDVRQEIRSIYQLNEAGLSLREKLLRLTLEESFFVPTTCSDVFVV